GEHLHLHSFPTRRSSDLKMTGEQGRIYGVDIQAEMLKMLKARAEEQGVRNITPVLSTATDPKLPKGKIDLILLVDVYHEFSHPRSEEHTSELQSPYDLVC